MVLPLSDSVISLWIAYLSLTLRHSTIKSYLGALSSVHMDHNYPSPYDIYPRVSTLMKAIKRSQGGTIGIDMSMKRRLPITVELVKLMDPHLRSHCGNQYHMYKAMITMGVYGMFRLSELAVTTRHNSRTLTLKHITFHSKPVSLVQQSIKPSSSSSSSTYKSYCAPFTSIPYSVLSECSHVVIHLDESKTDVNKVGVDQVVPGDEVVKCVTRYIKSLGASVSGSDRPLFQTRVGLAVSDRELKVVIKHCLSQLGIDMTLYRGFSCRRGGATTYAAMDIDTTMIMKLGRWQSDAVTRYIHPETQSFINAANSCSKVHK